VLQPDAFEEARRIILGVPLLVLSLRKQTLEDFAQHFR
jgi:hypothetical protein